MLNPYQLHCEWVPVLRIEQKQEEWCTCWFLKSILGLKSVWWVSDWFIKTVFPADYFLGPKTVIRNLLRKFFHIVWPLMTFVHMYNLSYWTESVRIWAPFDTENKLDIIYITSMFSRNLPLLASNNLREINAKRKSLSHSRKESKEAIVFTQNDIYSLDQCPVSLSLTSIV